MSPRYVDTHTLQGREDHILDNALDIISQQGITALTMDKLASHIDYSKGTLYNHFSSKEDVLAGLCNRNMQHVYDLFNRAIRIDAHARDKMIAISFAYLLSVLLSPKHFALVMSAKTKLFEKASPARRKEHDELDEALFSIMHGIIQEAIVKQELTLKADVDPQQVSFSAWAMAFGTIALLFNGENACKSTKGMLLENRVIAHSNIVMDGLGWQASTRDQQQFLAWLKNDLFANEVDALEQEGVRLRAA